jgi:predicted nucleic acid-binding protein
MIVVDTNIISYLYISSEKSEFAEQLLTSDPQWNAPILWRSEFRSVLSLYLRKNILNFNEILIILREAEKLMEGNEFEVSSHHTMKLVKSSNCSAYDCEFVALAEHLNVPLITADKKVLRAFPEVAKPLDAFLG